MQALMSSDELVLPGQIKVTKSGNVGQVQEGSFSLAFEVTQVLNFKIMKNSMKVKAFKGKTSAHNCKQI
jgi:hypothetical protein